ncbi:hypothetical protein GCM10009080_38470 [Cupriavidus pauculus]
MRAAIAVGLAHTDFIAPGDNLRKQAFGYRHTVDVHLQDEPAIRMRCVRSRIFHALNWLSPAKRRALGRRGHALVIKGPNA